MALEPRTGATFYVGDGLWVDGSEATNPGDNQILVDSGPLKQGNYLFAVITGASVDWVYYLEHRNALNDANISLQKRYPKAGNDDFFSPNKVFVAEGERLRVRLSGAITGVIQASIFTQEVL